MNESQAYMAAEIKARAYELVETEDGVEEFPNIYCNSASGRVDPRCNGCDYCLSDEPMPMTWRNGPDDPPELDGPEDEADYFLERGL